MKEKKFLQFKDDRIDETFTFYENYLDMTAGTALDGDKIYSRRKEGVELL